MIPVVVINLPRSADRRDDIAAHLGHLGIPYRLFAAVDGKTLSDAQRARYGSSLPLGAMGCAESHLALLREIADGPDEFVCILEDDVELAPAVVDLLDAAFLGSLPAFDVVRLESGADDRAAASIPIARRDGFEAHIAWRHHLATTAQIFSRAGARKIVAGLNTLPLAIDVALFLEHYVLGLRVIETRPSLARPRSGMTSEIGPGRLPPYTWWETFHKRKLRSREWRRTLSFAMAWGLPALIRLRRGARS